MSAAKQKLRDLAYTAAAGVAAAGCIVSACVSAITTWKLPRHIHGDNFMIGATAYVTEWARRLARCM